MPRGRTPDWKRASVGADAPASSGRARRRAARPLRVLITGGAGYIGSHTLVEVLAAGHEAFVVDNLCNARVEALARVEQVAGRGFGFRRCDVRDRPALDAVLAGFAPDAVIHLAGLKAVGESVAQPLAYFDNNVAGSLSLLQALQASPCRRVVFSSSATVYGEPRYLPIDEAHPLAAVNPYGRSKLHVEQILHDLSASDPAWAIACLRYFNPIGAHRSGRIGEDPTDTPNNLAPYVAQVAVGRRARLRVFGQDFGTPDGTGVRDYIHVADLAAAHLAAVDWTATAAGCEPFNLGTGRGTSVLEFVEAFATASGRIIPVDLAPRRAGDVAACYADPGKAARELGWQARRGIGEMCASAWRYQSENPHGYASGREAASPTAARGGDRKNEPAMPRGAGSSAMILAAGVTR